MVLYGCYDIGRFGFCVFGCFVIDLPVLGEVFALGLYLCDFLELGVWVLMFCACLFGLYILGVLFGFGCFDFWVW